jgi:APA family basic amino acid/polyamine antiporter
MADPSTPQTLRKDVGLLGVVTFGAGTAIGVSIFTVLQPTAQIAGSGLLAAIGVAAMPMILFAAAYAYLGSIMPISGASYEWPSRFLHPSVGFMITWLRIIANVGVLTILAQVMVGYLGMIVKLPPKTSLAVLLTLVFALNYIGVSIAAKIQSIMMGLLLVVLALFVISGGPALDLELIGSPLGRGPLAVLAAVPLMISLFLGIESAVEIGEEVRDARRTIPLGIALAIGLTALVYGLVAFTALGLVGPQALAASKAPLLDAARAPLGALAAPLIIGAAAVSIFKSMNAAALVFSRSLFAMGRSGALPRALGVVHPRFGTPHRAILLAYACAMCGLFLPPSLIFLLLAINVPTMLKYLACCLAASRVAQSHPDLHNSSQLGFGRRAVMGIGYLGALCAILITLFGIEADVRPYLLVGGWAAVGAAYWLVRGRKA